MPPGKPYTAGEMKAIVDYLVENDAYGQIKARKMWQDFASTRRVNRTWQSLKETFLKRILPDLRNPYYKLTAEQRRCFMEGRPMAAMNENKLEIRTLSENGSSTAGDNRTDNEQQKTFKNAGEGVKPSRMENRSQASTDTVVLEQYETAEDIIRVLESPTHNNSAHKSPSKSLRDFITYSEPLTPMAQEVLDDFATDEDEPQLQIIEDELLNCNGDNDSISSKRSSSSLGIRKSARLSPVIKKSKEPNKKGKGHRKSKSESPSRNKIRSLKLKKTRKGWENLSTEDDEPNPDTADKDRTESKADNKEAPNEIKKPATFNNTANSGNVTDTQLPNNQEQLGNHSTSGKLTSEGKADNKEASREITKPVTVYNTANSGNVTDTQLPNNQEQLGNHSTSGKPTSEGKADNKEAPKEITKPVTVNNTANSGNVTDSQLPNNQEQLGNHSTSGKPTSADDTADKDGTNAKIEVEKKPRKRDLSSASTAQKRKLRKNNENKGTKENKAKESQVPETGISNVEGTQTYDSHPNMQPNKTVQQEELTFNSHGNQPKEDKGTGKDIVTLSDNVEDATGKTNNNEINPKESINPCLKSVSLYAEQFSPTKYIHSDNGDANDDDDQAQNNNNKVQDAVAKDTTASEVQDDDLMEVENEWAPETETKSCDGKDKKNLFTQDVLVLKSYSESEAEQDTQQNNNPKVFRSEALEKIFGHASGPSINRKRSLGKFMKNKARRNAERRRSAPRIGRSRNLESGSSDHSSDSDHQLPKKFEPPAAYDILSHEGACFVASGSKLYPIIYVNKNQANIVLAKDRDEKPDSYWKQKYQEESKKLLEEKIRADELARLLTTAKSNESIPSRKPSCSRDQAPIVDITNDTSRSKDDPRDRKEKPVRIKFNKDKEVEMECDPTQFSSLFEQMRTIIFQTNVQQKQLERVQNEKMESSRTPTPEITEKVNKIENEIFQEIERKAKIDDSNVTKRKRGRPRKSPVGTPSETVTQSKKNRTSVVEATPSPEPKSAGNQPETDGNQPKSPEKTISRPGSGASKSKSLVNTSNSEEAEKSSPSTSKRSLSSPVISGTGRRPTRLPQKFPDNATAVTRPQSGQSLNRNPDVEIPDDPHIKYMFPPTRSHSETRAARAKKQYLKPTRLSPSNLSTDISQEYQESDCSPIPIMKMKKKRSVSLPRRKTIHPYLADAENSQSQDSQSKSIKNSTMNTSVYRSESYQVLMPKTLEQVDENSMDVKSVETRYHSLSPMSAKGNGDFETASNIARSCSTTSLHSPEISIVEKLSFNRDMLSVSEENPELNEIQTLEGMETSRPMVTDVVRDSLMEPYGQVQKSSNSAMSISQSVSSVASESLLRHINAYASNEDESSSDSLYVNLRNLLLESNKKKTMMEVDQIVETVKKARRKTSSTPFKRRSRITTPVSGPVLQEHTELCSRDGRQSCPPVINVIPPVEDITFESAPKTARRGRQKDVIKVKITKPRKKSVSKERPRSTSRLSSHTDSGINESDMLQGSNNNTIDLIHNHTETCLQTNECLRDSVDRTDSPNILETYIDNVIRDGVERLGSPIPTETRVNNVIIDDVERPESSNYRLYLTSDSEGSKTGFSDIFEGKIRQAHDLPVPKVSNCVAATELFSSDAQDATVLNAIPRASQGADSSDPSNPSYNSLITEDLTDESPPEMPSKWYLLSDEETNTASNDLAPKFNDDTPPSTNAVGDHTSVTGAHSNLKQLFTVCAVPDLSTISEASREDSRKSEFNSNSNTY